MTSPSNETGVISSGDYSLKTLTIVTSDGQVIDIKRIMLELNLFEDVFSPVMTGDVILGDAMDLISTFKMHGNEFLLVEVDKPSLNKPIKKIFRIYKISNRIFGSNSLQNYTIHFCSEELFLSTQTLISKSYKGIRIDQMVNDILMTKLQVNPNKMGGIFSQTKGSFDIIIPRMQALEAIQWLAPRAYNDNQNLFFFFENRDGFNFTSYENLINQPVYNTYDRSVKITQQPELNMNSFNYINIVEDFNILKAMRHGAFSSSLAVLDLVNQTFNAYNFNATQVADSALLNKNIPSNDLKSRLGFNFYTSTENMIKYIATADSDPTVNPQDVKNWMPQVSTRLGQINSFKIIISVPGDILLKAGALIGLVVPKMTPQDTQVQNDAMRTGNYFVSSVHHKFVLDTSVTILELLSDSINADLPQAAQTTETISKILKA